MVTLLNGGIYLIGLTLNMPYTSLDIPALKDIFYKNTLPLDWQLKNGKVMFTGDYDKFSFSCNVTILHTSRHNRLIASK